MAVSKGDLGRLAEAAERQGLAAIIRKVQGGKHLTAADMDFLRRAQEGGGGEVEEPGAVVAPPAPRVARKGAVKKGAKKAAGGRPAPRDWERVDAGLEEWVLQDGIVDGWRMDWPTVCRHVGLTAREGRGRLEVVQRELLVRYGFEVAEGEASRGDSRMWLELVKSIESVKRLQGDLELMVHSIRGRMKGGAQVSETTIEAMSEAVAMQSKLARQRDGLIVKVMAEVRAQKKAQAAQQQGESVMVVLEVLGGEIPRDEVD